MRSGSSAPEDDGGLIRTNHSTGHDRTWPWQGCCLVRYRLLTQLVDGQVPVQCWADVGCTLGREIQTEKGKRRQGLAGMVRLLGAAGAGRDQGAAQRQREKKKDRKEGFLLAI